MAAIDKIYGSDEQWQELLSWLAVNRPQYIRFLYPAHGYENPKDRPLSNFPGYADKWLWKNCPLPFVKAGIKFQYNGSPLRRRT